MPLTSLTTTGIWTKTLTSSTQLPRTTITKVLKILEGKKTVKTVKSVKVRPPLRGSQCLSCWSADILDRYSASQNPTRKIYMLANLVPSVELTGGPWFTDNELDTEFVDALKRLCKKIIEQKVCAAPGNQSFATELTSGSPVVPTQARLRQATTHQDYSTITSR